MNALGSSPRLRGTRNTSHSRRCTRGIIPALAGNTNVCSPRMRYRRDHPRACGEHTSTFKNFSTGPGSSPRLRGTLPWVGPCGVGYGIIPALAGNTAIGRASLSMIGDHPRACGEHIRNVNDYAFELGSSPRLRGTPALVHDREIHRGIIPALAGNTSPPMIPWSAAGDHPRACGEHVVCFEAVGPCIGSSPRLRGTRSRPG